MLFNVDRTVIAKHKKNIYSDLELEENRDVSRDIRDYNLDVAISTGYRVNSDKAIQFRRWETNILKDELEQVEIIVSAFLDLIDDRDVLKDEEKYHMK